MKRTRSLLFLFLSLIAVLCILTAWAVYRERRQERLNQDLIAAVKRNDTKGVISLLDQGADANCHDEPYKPLPWWQILQDRLRGVKPKPSAALTPLQVALQPHTIVTLNHGGKSYLAYAPPENLPLVKVLLDHKADVNVKSRGLSALENAIMGDEKATVHLYLHYGADMRPDAFGHAPLVDAVICLDDTDVLSDMLQRGADVNQRDGGNMATALWVAVRRSNIEAVRLLLSYHADVTLRGIDGLTPLAEAKGMGNPAEARQIIHLLQQAGAKE